jgi:hypothetical protein
MKKHLVRPERLRRVPPQFSWVDQRLFRGVRTARCDGDALALYLFLVTVADAQGLSFYSDASIARLLGWETLQLTAARQRLLDADLIAYGQPFYQVLSLDPIDPPAERIGAAVSVGEILRRALAKGGTP